MALPRRQYYRLVHSAIAGQGFLAGGVAWHWRAQSSRFRAYATEQTKSDSPSSASSTSQSSSSSRPRSPASESASAALSQQSQEKTARRDPEDDSAMPEGWEDMPDYNISAFSELPHRHFGFNQHMVVNAEFKEALRQVLWRFRAPIRYAFAYGSGVFPQDTKIPDPPPPSPHPNPPEAVKRWQVAGGKSIDFIFGVSHTQHWHSLNLNEHRDHYSFLGSFGSGVVKRVQDDFGAGAYFHPYITMNGMSVKYGVVNLDTLSRDLLEWDTLYLAGRLQKPVKILRDDPKIRLANQINLISALRTALLFLPQSFTERELYFSIAGLSYIGDPRMSFRAERPSKVYDIVDSQMANFRQLYYPLVDNLPNVRFNDARTSDARWMASPDINCRLEQDMDPVKRGNMVRRLPKRFQHRLYSHYQGIFNVPSKEFRDIVAGQKDEDAFSRRFGGEFDQRIGTHPGIGSALKQVVSKTVTWPTVMQSFKGILTAGPTRSLQYLSEKRAKGRAPQKPEAGQPEKNKGSDSSAGDSSSSSSKRSSSSENDAKEGR